MTTKGAILASPLLCLGVLTVIAADNARHVKPHDAEPYHARAKVAIEHFPLYITGSDYWFGHEVEQPAAAVKILHPNALISRRYTNHPRANGQFIWADLLISQCRDSRDMTGHYPPICYPSNGERLLTSLPVHLKAADTWIDGTEYQFQAKPGQGCERKSVYNFFIVPGRGVVPDIKDVREAAGDYERCYFGAAQFQVIIDADQPPEVRDEVFTTLIGADPGILKTLECADIKD
jgi:hypothetical protein